MTSLDCNIQIGQRIPADLDIENIVKAIVQKHASRNRLAPLFVQDISVLRSGTIFFKLKTISDDTEIGSIFNEVIKEVEKEVKKELDLITTTKEVKQMSAEQRKIFVIHGRNRLARDAMFNFLRALDLNPIEWDDAVAATGKGSPYTREILEKGFEMAHAVIVLFTGDEKTKLQEAYWEHTDSVEEKQYMPQPRPNVLFEAGMAMALHPDRTIIVQCGTIRNFSDIKGMNYISISNDATKKKALIDRLNSINCPVKQTGNDWISVGDFDAAASYIDNFENEKKNRQQNNQ